MLSNILKNRLEEAIDCDYNDNRSICNRKGEQSMRHTKKKNRQLTVAMAAVVFSLSAAAVDAYASSVTDTQEQVMIEDEETIEIDPIIPM